jgi:hypothetical protein
LQKNLLLDPKIISAFSVRNTARTAPNRPTIDRRTLRMVMLLAMKHATPVKQRQRAAERRARLHAVVKRARAAGEKVPPGIKLIDFRDLKPEEIARGKSLEKVAAACLSRGKAVL